MTSSGATTDSRDALRVQLRQVGGYAEQVQLLAPTGGDGATGDEGADTASPSVWSTIVRAHFGDWDADGDGYISETEIDAVVSNPDVQGAEASAAAQTKRYLSELEELSNDEWGDEDDGLTLADLTIYEQSFPHPDDSAVKRLESNHVRGVGRINDTSRQLFANGSPDPYALRQGSIGDCYFLSALVSLEVQRPGSIEGMIDPRDDGSFVVTFPNRDAITVAAPTDAEIARAATAGADGIWVTVLEKAYGLIRSDLDAGEAQDEIDDPDTPGEGVAMVTGGSTDTDILSLTALATTRRKLSAALPGKVVNALISSDNDLNLPSGHIYSVLDYDAGADEVTLRNPWGHRETTDDTGAARDGTDDGVFTLGLVEFDSIFMSICYEE